MHLAIDLPRLDTGPVSFSPTAQPEPDLPPAVEWIERNFFIPELDGPIRLYPYQKAVLREACRRDEDGHYAYSIVVWSDIKKSAKSTIAAALALYRAYARRWGSIKIVANDLKQADSRVAYYLRRAIQLNQAMEDIRQVGYTTTLPNQTVIEALPIDPGGEAGGNDDLIIFSELWAAKHKAMHQMWTEMTLSPTKFGHSQRWIETYAGYSGESPILEQLYHDGVKEGEPLDLSYSDEDGHHDLSDLEVYGGDEILCLWNTRPRLPWQTKRYYAAERKALTPDEFSRIHRNQWISSTAKFVPDEWWDACEGQIPPFRRRQPLILSLDASVSGDCFGIVGASYVDDTAYVRYSRKWEPPKDGKIDYLGTPQAPGPEREIIRLCWLYNVTELRYDPYQLHDMATRLKRGVPVDEQGNIVEVGEDGKATGQVARIIKVNAVEFTQQGQRLRADKQLFDRIRERRIVHDGDEGLREHVSNANQKNDEEGSKLRIVKRSQHLKIDLCVAASMATFVEEEEEKPPPAVLAQGRARGWQPK